MRSNVEKQLLRINFWFLGPFADEQHIWTDLPPDHVVRTRKHLDPVQTAEANHNDAGQTTSSWLSKYSTAGASFSPESIVQLAATGQLPPSIEDRLRTGTNHDSTSTQSTSVVRSQRLWPWIVLVRASISYEYLYSHYRFLNLQISINEQMEKFYNPEFLPRSIERADLFLFF
jgi:hypothetical protein